MNSAFDPITGRPITPETHALRKQRHGLNAICRLCKTEVFDHSVGSLEVIAHFNHRPDSGPCALKGQQADKTNFDYSGNGDRLRKEFFSPDSIQFAFSACQALVCGSLRGSRYVKNNFGIKRFKELLHIADSRRKWALKGLTPKLVPFALVAHEIFDLRYREGDTSQHAFTFTLGKKAQSSEGRRYDRPLAVDHDEPILLTKRFLNDDGSIGGIVGKLAPGNPYTVSETNALSLVGSEWHRLKQHHVQNILAEFVR